jgi:hypothetical protein
VASIKVICCPFGAIDNILDITVEWHSWSTSCADTEDEGVSTWPDILSFLVGYLNRNIVECSAINEPLVIFPNLDGIKDGGCGGGCTASFPNPALIVQNVSPLGISIRSQDCRFGIVLSSSNHKPKLFNGLS